MDINSRKTLSNGVEIPLIGLGVYLSPRGESTASAVRWAIEAGYRHIDTAAIYGNESSVGEGIRTSGISRDQLFITSKLWNDDIRKGRTLEAFKESLSRLGTDYLDLYLIHWPAEGHERAWQVLEELYQSGSVRAIGVSNYHLQHIDELEREAKIMPMLNQFECHPYLSQGPLIELCRQRGMAYESYSPLGGQNGTILSDPKIAEIAAKHNKTPAQITLRWHLQRGSIILPKSNHKDRIISNSQLFNFSLSEEEMNEIGNLDRGIRTGGNPDCFNF